MQRLEAWMRFGAVLVCADGVVSAEELDSMASLASTLAGTDDATARRYLDEAKAGTGPSTEEVIAALGASSADRAIELLRRCYRIVVADGEEHATETVLLRAAAERLLGKGNGERALSFLRRDHEAAQQRDALEDAAYEAGCIIELDQIEGGV